VGLGGDVGTATSVTRAGFDGTWRAWAVRARLGWSHAYGAWEIEPHAGVGVLRSTLDGTEMKTPRSEATTLVTARGGLSLRRRLAPWSFGVTLDLDVIFGTPTYSKAGAAAEIFQVPGAGAALGTVIAVDL
jgi:hypothetical protein